MQNQEIETEEAGLLAPRREKGLPLQGRGTGLRAGGRQAVEQNMSCSSQHYVITALKCTQDSLKMMRQLRRV